ncbi:unnamed protein product [Vicia faba]|uniref:Uncharacterized protein n=1 Tax=Vicia faba TaxID=3906 RepID=A0AAV0ZVY6_VICFA|nr:unnamed protein product [Vicia faba]
MVRIDSHIAVSISLNYLYNPNPLQVSGDDVTLSFPVSRLHSLSTILSASKQFFPLHHSLSIFSDLSSSSSSFHSFTFLFFPISLTVNSTVLDSLKNHKTPLVLTTSHHLLQRLQQESTRTLYIISIIFKDFKTNHARLKNNSASHHNTHQQTDHGAEQSIHRRRRLRGRGHAYELIDSNLNTPALPDFCSSSSSSKRTGLLRTSV